MTVLCRKGGSWGTWHVVRGKNALPICGQRSRLDNAVVAVPEGVERRIHEGTQQGVCGSCMRLARRKVVA